MPAEDERVHILVEPIVRARRCSLYDLELLARGPTRILRVFVDRPGGVDTDTLAQVNQAVSRALDEADVIDGRYTLEVSSPGLERALRRPDHFMAVAGGDTIARVKVRSGAGARIVEGAVVEADDDSVTIGDESIRYDDVVSARTVFTWGPSPRPAKPAAGKAKAVKGGAR